MSSVLKESNTAVITGASSGIGRAAALDFASRGMNVWMIDIDAEELKLAKELVSSKRKNETQRIEERVVDVSDFDAMSALADEVFTNDGRCHFLMNNAGIGTGGGPIETDVKIMNRIMGVNTYGPIHGCMAFASRMMNAGPGDEAWIVNTGSKQGITKPPGNLMYNMSKAALNCYTEGLEHELRTGRAKDEHKVRAALLIPGWVNTSILLKSQREKALAAGQTDFDPASCFFHEMKPAAGAWMPHQVVEFMIQELDQERFYIVCPDNDVDRDTDNIRMTWTMQDITENRPPLSRWHPDYSEKFKAFVEESKKSPS